MIPAYLADRPEQNHRRLRLSARLRKLREPGEAHLHQAIASYVHYILPRPVYKDFTSIPHRFPLQLRLLNVRRCERQQHSMPLHQISVQRPRLPHPRRQLRVVSVPVVRVRVDEHAQRAAVHCEPGEECAGLVWREGVYFEHRYGVGACEGRQPFADTGTDGEEGG